MYKRYRFIINDYTEKEFFPDDLKLLDISPTFKNIDSFNKVNYRPVSISPQMSKVFERITYKKINTFMRTKSFPYLCGFRKKS